MKKKNLIKGGAAGLLTLLLTAAMGCFASFAYDSASLKTCTVENRNTVVITGTAEKDVPQETVPETLEDGTVVPPETEVPDDGYYYLFELQPYETGIGSLFPGEIQIPGCIPGLWWPLRSGIPTRPSALPFM